MRFGELIFWSHHIANAFICSMTFNLHYVVNHKKNLKRFDEETKRKDDHGENIKNLS